MNGIQEVEGSIPFVSTRKKARTAEKLYEPSVRQRAKEKRERISPKLKRRKIKKKFRRAVSKRDKKAEKKLPFLHSEELKRKVEEKVR